MALVRLQDARGEHGRQRQRNKTGYHHSSRHRQRKFQEQATGIARCKCQRRKHRGQRHGHRRIGADRDIGIVREAAVGKGAKANHLSYLGDGSIAILRRFT